MLVYLSYENGNIVLVYNLYFHRLPEGRFGFQTACPALCHRLRRMGIVRLVLFGAHEKEG